MILNENMLGNFVFTKRTCWEDVNLFVVSGNVNEVELLSINSDTYSTKNWNFNNEESVQNFITHFALLPIQIYDLLEYGGKNVKITNIMYTQNHSEYVVRLNNLHRDTEYINIPLRRALELPKLS
tara:strand:+ start:5897 stop:6271 length:375 start_codon:yes stop_codon:yes gene_type:complete